MGRAGWSLGYAGFSRVGRRDQQNPLTWKCDLMSMSGCQLCHGFIRWHQKLLFLNLPSAKSEQGTPPPRSETQHDAGDAETLEEKLLCEHQNSCLVPPLGEEEDALLYPLGLGTHGEGKSEFRTCQMRKDILHTMKESITGV